MNEIRQIVWVALSVLLLLMLLLLSCEKEPDDGGWTNRTKHVILIYLGGDNNLSSETYQKIEAMRLGWGAQADKQLVIYADPSDAPPSLVEIVREKGQNVMKTIATYEDENSADAEVFSRVINEVKALYPASSYGLILFSHASGWLPEHTLTSPRSVLMDGTQEMELGDFATAIPDNAFEYIIFEACFMAGVEVAYELREKTNYILASSAEIVSPGFTHIYANSLNHLSGSIEGLMAFADDAFLWFDTQSGYLRSATFSIIKTAELGSLARWVKDNGFFNKQIEMESLQYFDRYSYHLFFDFADSYKVFSNNEEEKKKLVDLMRNCVVWRKATPFFMIDYNGFEIKNHSGLTTYIVQEKYPMLNAAYKKLQWFKVVNGDELNE